MTSQIDPTVPIFGTPTTASVRHNFLIAYNEITALQQNLAGGGQEGFTVGIANSGPLYTVVPPINYVSVKVAPLTVLLPTAVAAGYSVMVKDSLGLSNPTNQIVVQSSTSIDGLSSYNMNTGFSAFRFTFDGTGWAVSG